MASSETGDGGIRGGMANLSSPGRRAPWSWNTLAESSACAASSISSSARCSDPMLGTAGGKSFPHLATAAN